MRTVRFLSSLLVFLSLLLGFHLPALAENGQPEPGDGAGITGEGVPAKAPAAQQEDGFERIFVINGATISWDLDRRQFHPPTAEQAAKLAAELRKWMETELADGEGKLPPVKDVEVETLPDGVKKARLPLHLMSFASVRVDREGELSGHCAEGPGQEILDTPPAAGEEDR